MLNFLFSKTPLLFLVQSFWRDEAFSYVLSKQSIIDILIKTAHDFNPPLYYLLLHGWMKFFGNSEIVLRLPSVIFFVITLYGLYVYMEKIFKIPMGKIFLYLILASLNPMLLSYAFEARMYSMFACFSLLSTYFFLRKNKKGYFVATLLGLYTHYFMLLVVGGHVLYLFLTSKRKHAIQEIKTYVPAILLFIPWVLFVFLVKRPLFDSFWILTLPLKDLLTVPFRLYTGFERNFSISYFFQSIIIFGAALIGLNLRRENILFLTLSLGIGYTLAVVSLFKPVFLPRYLIFTTPFLILLMVQSLERLPAWGRGVLIGVLFIVTMQYLSFQVAHLRKLPYDRVIGEIKRLAGPKDYLYVASELDYFTGLYYFDERRVKIYNKPYSDIPSFTGKALIPQSALTKVLPMYPTKAFILSPDLTYAIQANF